MVKNRTHNTKTSFFASTVFAVSVLISGTALAPLTDAHAAELPKPTGRVVLTVKGNIANTNGEQVAELDRAMLESLGMKSFSTRTPWTDNPNHFEGPLMRDLLTYVGAGSDTFQLVAHDDYEVKISGVDFDGYPVILALKMDGKYMSLRRKGPSWMIFPWDDHPELHRMVNSSLSVWQIKEMVID